MFPFNLNAITMKNIFKALLAGWGAKKLSQKGGCGCIGTIVIFGILYVILGYIFEWF